MWAREVAAAGRQLLAGYTPHVPLPKTPSTHVVRLVSGLEANSGRSAMIRISCSSVPPNGQLNLAYSLMSPNSSLSLSSVLCCSRNSLSPQLRALLFSAFQPNRCAGMCVRTPGVEEGTQLQKVWEVFLDVLIVANKCHSYLLGSS